MMVASDGNFKKGEKKEESFMALLTLSFCYFKLVHSPKRVL